MRVAAILSSVLVLLCSQAASAQDKPFNIPGTGIALTPPPNTALARVGPTLTDVKGEIVITILTTEERLNPANNEIWQAIFPHPAEDLKSSIAGKLSRRTRAADGGGWDGYMLTAVRDGKALQIMAMYTGNSAEVFDGLGKHLRTASWDPAGGKPETAAGVSFQFKGLKLVNGVIGGLSYNTTGEIAAKGTSVLVQPMPVPLAKENEVFPANCEKVLASAFGRAKYLGPVTKTLPKHAYCEVWSDAPTTEGKYLALVKLKSGGLLTVWGSSSGPEFAAALTIFRGGVTGMQILRAP